LLNLKEGILKGFLREAPTKKLFCNTKELLET